MFRSLFRSSSGSS